MVTDILGKKLSIGDIVITAGLSGELYIKRIVGFNNNFLDYGEPIFDYDEYKSGFGDKSVFVITDYVDNNIASGVGE